MPTIRVQMNNGLRRKVCIRMSLDKSKRSPRNCRKIFISFGSIVVGASAFGSRRRGRHAAQLSSNDQSASTKAATAVCSNFQASISACRLSKAPHLRLQQQTPPRRGKQSLVLGSLNSRWIQDYYKLSSSLSFFWASILHGLKT